MTHQPPAKTGFRTDINGLRALAVVAVILFHFQIAGFNGGFVGVDVFFVISGFLMTGIVVRGLEKQSFSLLGFYLARAKRIVPALIATCVVLLVLGWFFLLPSDYKTLSSHAVYSVTFLSNIEYFREANYFDVDSHEKWLLHTWSLSVEWQFYLLLPLMLMLVWRIRPGIAAQRWFLIAAAIVSLLASVVVTSTDATAAFYLLPTRAWEMIAGGLVFLVAQDRQMPPRLSRAMELFGILLMLLAVAIFDKNSMWPGWRATVPVVGAMLVLAANRTSAFTGNRIAQWLGDRSYSLYLWHWPVCVTLVYMEYILVPAAVALGLLVTLLLGHLSYVAIETSSRRSLAKTSVGLTGIAITLMVALATVPALAIWRGAGIPGRFSTKIEAAAAEANNINPRRSFCHTLVSVSSASCVYGGTKWKAIVLGDSHAGAIMSAFENVAPGTAGVVQWSYSGCPFVPGLKVMKYDGPRSASQSDCAGFVRWASAQLAGASPDIPVVIINRYAAAAFGPNEGWGEETEPQIYFSRKYSTATPAYLKEFAAHITASACRIAKTRTVYMMRPVPEMGIDVPKTLSRRLIFGTGDDVSISLADYQKRNGWVWAAQDAARDQCGIRILDPLPYLCHDGRCYGTRAGRPLYHDDDHLSEFGNKLLTPMFAGVARRP